MNEDALRALIRDSITRHLGGVQDPHRDSVEPVPVSFLGHASHYRYTVPTSGDTACIIEPGVTCNHCGYCESHGH